MRFRIAVFATNGKNVYSGGRYASYALAECLAEVGHDVFYITNNKPIFYDDFKENSNHSKVNIVVSGKFIIDDNNEKFDFVFLTPHQSSNQDFYTVVKQFARDRDARLVLINFESPNWFNEYAPVKRDVAMWDEWLNCCDESCLILSISKEGMKYAKEFYTRNPKHVYFDYWYPSINSNVADQVSVKKEKRILILSRFTDAHKGNDEIFDLISESMRGYTLVFIVGIGKVSDENLNILNTLSEKYGINYDIKYQLDDKAKFEEISKAEILVFPSKFEGYGYPPIEAQYCGTKCIVYDLPVLRETSGDGLIYADYGNFTKFKELLNEHLGLDYSPEDYQRNMDDIGKFENRARALDEVLQKHYIEKKEFKPTVELKKIEINDERTNVRLRSTLKALFNKVTINKKSQAHLSRVYINSEVFQLKGWLETQHDYDYVEVQLENGDKFVINDKLKRPDLKAKFTELKSYECGFECSVKKPDSEEIERVTIKLIYGGITVDQINVSDFDRVVESNEPIMKVNFRE